MGCEFTGHFYLGERAYIERTLTRYERVAGGPWHAEPQWVIARHLVGGRPVLTVVDTS